MSFRRISNVNKCRKRIRSRWRDAGRSAFVSPLILRTGTRMHGTESTDAPIAGRGRKSRPARRPTSRLFRCCGFFLAVLLGVRLGGEKGRERVLRGNHALKTIIRTGLVASQGHRVDGSLPSNPLGIRCTTQY